MLGEVVLEEGKIYLVRSESSGWTWLFKKHNGISSDKITGCSNAICLDDMYTDYYGGYVCSDDDISYLKPANRNYIAIWNRVFNDNIEMV